MTHSLVWLFLGEIDLSVHSVSLGCLVLIMYPKLVTPLGTMFSMMWCLRSMYLEAATCHVHGPLGLHMVEHYGMMWQLVRRIKATHHNANEGKTDNSVS